MSNTSPAALRTITGRAVQTDDPELAEAHLAAGGKLISAAEAAEATRAAKNLAYVDQNWGVAGKLGLGLASGLSLGMAPGAMAKLGLLDPGHVAAAQTSGWYTAGDVAGMVAPALLTGGEGLAGRLASLSPAGFLETGAGATERLVGKLIGEAPGVWGQLASTPIKMAARGAVEGAAINMGHNVGEHLLHNKPLAAESLLAAGAEGALFGGLIGGSLGTVGSLSGMAADSLSAFGKSAIGRSGAAEGIVAKRLGMTSEQVVEKSAAEGGLKAYNKQVSEVLEKSGTDAKIGSSDTKLKDAFVKAKDHYTTEWNDVVKTLDSQAAHLSPSLERIEARLNSEVMAPRIGTYGEQATAGILDTVKSRLSDLSPPQVLKPVMKDGQEVVMGMKVPSGELPSWQKWVQSRDQLAAELKGVGSEIKAEVLNVIDSEIKNAMTAAGDGLAEKFAAARTGAQIAETLEENLGKKMAQKLLSTEPTITGRDLALFGAAAVGGHGVTGLGWLAGKGVSRQLQGRLEPGLAQMAFDMSIGTKASMATRAVQTKTTESIKKFFKASTKAPSKAAYSAEAKKSSKEKVSPRKKYEDTVSRTEQLISEYHQDRVRRYAEGIHQMGYADLAKSLMETNNRAVQYLLWNMPARQGTKGLASLRKQPASKFPTLEEYKFLRIDKAIKDPLSVLDDLETGKVSRDAVKAIKHVYPELHSQIVQTAADQIYEMKMNGEHLPMSKIAHLGVVLDSPVDSTLTAEYIGEVQAALNAPPPEPNDQPDRPPADSVMERTSDLLTPAQKAQLI